MSKMLLSTDVTIQRWSIVLEAIIEPQNLSLMLFAYNNIGFITSAPFFLDYVVLHFQLHDN